VTFKIRAAQTFRELSFLERSNTQIHPPKK
jgi:hypothetical protein